MSCLDMIAASSLPSTHWCQCARLVVWLRFLQDHMASEHFLCEEPECLDCLSAFATMEELRHHHLRVMPLPCLKHSNCRQSTWDV